MKNKEIIEALCMNVLVAYDGDLEKRKIVRELIISGERDEFLKVSLKIRYNGILGEQVYDAHLFDIEFGDGVDCIYFVPMDDSGGQRVDKQINWPNEQVEQYFRNWNGTMYAVTYLVAHAIENITVMYDDDVPEEE